MSVPHHDGLFMDRVDDCLDEEIDGTTENVFYARENNPVKQNGGTDVDIILSRLSIPRNQSAVISKGWCVRGVLSSGFIK